MTVVNGTATSPDDARTARSARRVAMIAIGRNEGERLRRCIESVSRHASAVVYVDSGSTDGSVALARSLGADVVELDMNEAFTAARARNAGLGRIAQTAANTDYVQFVDGDCEVLPHWIEQAAVFLDTHPDVVAVCGRRRERFPERSVYNMLCDLEWDTPVGQARAFGGDVLIRLDPLVRVGGYRDDLIAGEEPELGVRLRAAGWKIWRLDADMTLHDAAIIRFGQWWKRTMRGGYAFAQGAAIHGAKPERHWVQESRRAWLWGAVLPLLVLVAVVLWGAWGLLGLLIFPLQAARLFLRDSGPARVRGWRAVFLVLGKFPEAAGQLKFVFHRWVGARGRLIEYK